MNKPPRLSNNGSDGDGVAFLITFSVVLFALGVLAGAGVVWVLMR